MADARHPGDDGDERAYERAAELLRADRPERTSEELRAAATELSSALGADPDYAVVAALERLTEMRAAGTVSEENYNRERRRLSGSAGG